MNATVKKQGNCARDLGKGGQLLADGGERTAVLGGHLGAGGGGVGL